MKDYCLGWARFGLVEEEKKGILGRKKRREKRYGSGNRACLGN